MSWPFGHLTIYTRAVETNLHGTHLLLVRSYLSLVGWLHYEIIFDSICVTGRMFNNFEEKKKKTIKLISESMTHLTSLMTIMLTYLYRLLPLWTICYFLNWMMHTTLFWSCFLMINAVNKILSKNTSMKKPPTRSHNIYFYYNDLEIPFFFLQMKFFNGF